MKMNNRHNTLLLCTGRTQYITLLYSITLTERKESSQNSKLRTMVTSVQRLIRPWLRLGRWSWRSRPASAGTPGRSASSATPPSSGTRDRDGSGGSGGSGGSDVGDSGATMYGRLAGDSFVPDYNDLPTFPPRPRFDNFSNPLHPLSQTVVFDGCPEDPHRPSSTPLYQTSTFQQPAADTFGAYDYTSLWEPHSNSA